MSETSLIAWRTSSYTSNGGNCVEVGWRISSYSTTNGDCVEVGRDRQAILVRDTKDRTGGTLGFPAAQWRLLLTHLG
ncbi:DUF397 domain-containing protein [Amycolatopsis sp. CA-230715]|uniref:DUF397 domain-containing protein n=1 Tax=Amycolatopsis sp. CA-230715 TaxID=2745196 RepID=UPI001C00A98D|nr:DUF397 domain-containing protein [Amycolatopsis sp. CA-230715]QWF81987.1 hypothetical protein HUW46_05423 [Amycolatopsis sp. CA-230715]